MKLFKSGSTRFVGLSTWERLVRCVTEQMRENTYGGQARVAPQTFEDVQNWLVMTHNPTVVAQWEGDECSLRVAVCGRALTIRADDGLEDYDFSLSERGD